MRCCEGESAELHDLLVINFVRTIVALSFRPLWHWHTFVGSEDGSAEEYRFVECSKLLVRSSIMGAKSTSCHVLARPAPKLSLKLAG